MTIHSLCIIDTSGVLVLSYYFVKADADDWESRLAAETSEYWSASARQDVPCVVGGQFVLLRGVGDLVFIMSGVGEHDELALVEAISYAVAVVEATCDGHLNAAKVMAFHGKVCVCLNEMFFGGHQAMTDVEAVLRNAKLKAPKV